MARIGWRDLPGLAKRAGQNKWVSTGFVLSILAAAIVLMVVPAELISPAPSASALDLKTTFSTLTYKGWLSLVFIFIGFVLMVFDIVQADLAMNLVLMLMTVFNILTPKVAIGGYAQTGLWTILVLMIVAAGITATGGAEFLISKVLGTPKDIMLAQVRMCLITLLFSSFVNDTPVYCIMMPIVLTWAAKARLNIKQLLIPLSWCCLLGGLNTTIGTSTNLVVTGQFDSKVLDPKSPYYQKGLSPISMFDIAPYGVPNGIWSIIYIVLASPFLLNGGAGKRTFLKYKQTFSRKRTEKTIVGEGADFFVGLLVAEDSPAVGHTLRDSGLWGLQGLSVTSVRRNGEVLHAVGRSFTVAAGDVIYYSGVPDDINSIAADFRLVPHSDALERIDDTQVPGLSSAFGVSSIIAPRLASFKRSDSDDLKAGGSDGDEVPAGLNPPELVQASIKQGSSLAGKTIREAAFLSRFHAAVVSVKRDSIPLEWSGPIGDEVLKAGDELLLDVLPQFWTTPEVNAEFVNISQGGQTKTNNEFSVPMRVTRFLAGSTVKGSGLRQLPSAFLVSIERRGTSLHAISDEEVLQLDDILWFAATAGSVRFIRITPGLVMVADEQSSKLKNVRNVDRRLVQAIVAVGAPIVGKTIAESRFREQFNAAVVAVSRKGQRLRQRLAEIELRAGDILLLDTGDAFARVHRDSKYFSIVLELEMSNPPRYLQTFVCFALVVTAFVLYAVSVLDILTGAAVAVAALLLTGTLSADQARNAIRWDVFLMIGGSFGVSYGLENSGGAAAIGNLIVTIGAGWGGEGFVVACVYIATTLLSQIIANNSAAALMFPIVATISKNDGYDIYILSYAIMLGASSVFMSSFGYQTNLMALAAGGHSSRDFLRLGTPLQLLLAVVSIVILVKSQYWGWVWLATGIAGAVVLGAPQVLEFTQMWQNRKKAKGAAQLGGPAEADSPVKASAKQVETA